MRVAAHPAVDHRVDADIAGGDVLADVTPAVAAGVDALSDERLSLWGKIKALAAVWRPGVD